MWWKKSLLVVGSLLTMTVVWAANSPTVHQPSPNPPVENQIEVTDSEISTKTVEDKSVVPHGFQTVNDSSLAKGTTEIRQVGIDGEKTSTYEIQLQGSIEISRKLITEVTSVTPVTEIKAVGTKVVTPAAPNGTYKNVDGNIIPSPYYAPSAPAGASARCGDGTYSFSAHRQGTCSHHGGVAQWL